MSFTELMAIRGISEKVKETMTRPATGLSTRPQAPGRSNPFRRTMQEVGAFIARMFG